MKTAYCFGHISTGKLYRIQGEYPKANGYAEYFEVSDNFAGEALSTSVVLSRLGIQPTLEGNWIGDNEAGEKTIEFIHTQNIYAPTVHIQKGYIGVNEVVISDSSSRTVFGRYCDLLFTTPQWEMPDKSLIANCNISCADPSFGEASLLVAKYSKELEIPFISIDAPYDSELVKVSSVTIISEDFLKQKYIDVEFELVFDSYLQSCPGLVIFTFGAHELWYGRDSKQTYKPFVVPVIDTAGAGDSFRAGIMYGILHTLPDEKMIQFSCAVSAAVIQTSPGVVNFKGLQEVEVIINANK